MTVLRSDIERALDDLISNECGMAFQGLAVILARKRWPDLIASERKKDLGADAIGEGRVLACSLSADLKKIRTDAAKIKQTFDIRTRTLIFATAKCVTNTTARNLAIAIRSEFDYELIVMSREDLIASLMDPANAALCRNHLGIPIGLEQPTAELLQSVNESTSEVVADWSVPLRGKPFIELRAEATDPNATDLLDLSYFQRALMQGRRLVIEAPAGRGKTTTLVQLAARQDGTREAAFLIDLPGWVRSGIGILQYIAAMPAFQSHSVSAAALARLQNEVHFSFLLNGWNEIRQSDSLLADQALREMEREFPAAGILVATRAHYLAPPLPGALRAMLLPLNPAQRKRYLEDRRVANADQLCAKLENDPLLDELTRTPLFLSEAASLFEAGKPIPQTKMGVLESVIQLLEQSEGHLNHLQEAPLSGRAHEYLSALAAEMTKLGAVTLPEVRARAVAHAVAEGLRNARQIAALPEPQKVLTALCAHHVLELLTYPARSFRFSHQQFQEFYAALLLKQQLLVLVQRETPQTALDYTNHYLNEPAWSEPLRMIANEIGVPAAIDPLPTRSGVLLIQMALSADLIFAAELACLCALPVWKEIRGALAGHLRSLYAAPEVHARQRALAGMLATGSDEFKDIIIPLLTSDDQQVRLGVYRAWPRFHVSSLGSDWQKIVRGWNAEARSDFVSELLHFGNAPKTLASFALKDESMKVRIAAVSALTWNRSKAEIGILLESLDDETLKAVLRKLPPVDIPASTTPRVLASYQKLRHESADPVARLRISLRISELTCEDTTPDLKEDLSKCAHTALEQNAPYAIKPALALIRQIDPQWVSHWVAERLVDGSLQSANWVALVASIPPALKEQLLHRFESGTLNPALDSGAISLLSVVADVDLVSRILTRLSELRSVIAAAPVGSHTLERAIERQLVDLFGALPANLAVDGLAFLSSPSVEPSDLILLTRLLGSLARQAPDLRATLRGDLRKALRAYLRRGTAVVLRQEDFNGEQKANFASALAEVGEQEDIGELRKLILADIARLREGKSAREQGDRGRKGSGATMHYGNLHVQALVRLSPDTADFVLLETLKEPEYEGDSAWGLVQLASGCSATGGFGLGPIIRTDYATIWKARQGQLPSIFDEERRKQYAAAIRSQIETLLRESRDAGQPQSYDFRLKELTRALAVIDSHGSTDLILTLLSFHNSRNAWPVVEALETLLFNGIVLPTDKTLGIFDSLLEHVRSHLHDTQQVGLLIRALCLLPFIEDATTGIRKAREAIRDLKLQGHQLWKLATAAGFSRCPEAIQLLRDFASGPNPPKVLDAAWINALAALDSPEARELLLSFVDPATPGAPAGAMIDCEDVLAARLAELALRDEATKQRLLQLCTLRLPPARRNPLARVLLMLGSQDAILAGLNLIDDAAIPPVPYEIWKLLEATFVEYKSVRPESNTYLRLPREANPIRNRLLEMTASDERGKDSATSLLGQIEMWRLEYGRPIGEPRNPHIKHQTPWPAP